MSKSAVPAQPRRGGLFSALLALVFGALGCATGLLVLAYGEARMNRGIAVARATHLNEAPANSGASITVSGPIGVTAPAVDPLLAGEWAYIQRLVDTCAWLEDTGRDKNRPPTYKKKWVREVPDSALFKARGYDNPAPALKSTEAFATGLRVDSTYVGAPVKVLGAETLAPERTQVLGARIVSEQWAYLAVAKECQSGGAAVGDQRVSFRVLRPGDLTTVYGVLRGSHVEPAAEAVLLTKGGRQSLLEGMEKQKSPYAWFFRAVGAILLWAGFTLLLSPVLMVVGWLPIVGGLARGAARLLAIVLALLITLGVVYQGYGMGLVARLFGGAFG